MTASLGALAKTPDDRGADRRGVHRIPLGMKGNQMKIANEFTVSAPIEQAWDVLNDLEQVMPLMPGAQLTGRDGEDVLGKVKVKVGPVTSEFSGKVHFVEQDRDDYRAVIDAKGKEAARAPATRRPPSPRNCTKRASAPASPWTPTSRSSESSRSSAAACCNRFRRSCSASSSTRWRPNWSPKQRRPPRPRRRASAVQVSGDPVPTMRPAAPPAAEPAPIDLLELAGGTALTARSTRPKRTHKISGPRVRS